MATSPAAASADARPIGETRAESRGDRAGGSFARPERARAVKPSLAAGAVRRAKRVTEAPV